MKKLFYHNEVLFAVLMIIIYVVGFSNADILSESIGMEKSVTAAFGLVLSAALLVFIHKNSLYRHTGLCAFRGNIKKYLYVIPLLAMSSVNLINGFQMNLSVSASVFMVVSMIFVGFLEEIIFRGFLFRAMAKDNLKIAVVVSSVTFGIGHIVNLLLGEPVLGTLLQVVYASAIGFLYTAIFLTGKSLIPCILSHAFINATSTFARPMTDTADVIVAVLETVLSACYGAWLLMGMRAEGASQEDIQ